MSRIFIRADASGEIGSGHVMRCITLADELARRGANVAFICRDILPVLAEKVRAHGHALHLLPPASDPRPNDGAAHAHWLQAHWSEDCRHTREVLQQMEGVDWLIADHYALDARWETPLRDVARQIMVLDDLADRAHDCDLLLDHAIYRKPGDYDSLIPATARLLTGGEYFLLRPEFHELRKKSLERRKQIKGIEKILINFGGTFKNEAIEAALHAVERVFGNRASVILVQGKSGGGEDEAERHFRKNFSFPIQVYEFVEDMAALMCHVDLVMGAAGMSSLERFCLGLPAISVSVADNQEIAVRAYARTGGVMHGSVDTEELALLLQQLDEQPEMLYGMSKAAARITDGLGVYRTAGIIMQ